jgi:hypothetical protein
MRRITLLRLDFDGCIGDEIERMRDAYARGWPDDAIFRFVARDYRNFPILNHMVENIFCDHPEEIIIMSFSNRQDYQTEWSNGRKHFDNDKLDYNPKNMFELGSFSSIFGILIYQELLKRIFPGKKITLFPFLLADFEYCGYSICFDVGDVFAEIRSRFSKENRYSSKWKDEEKKVNDLLRLEIAGERHKLLLSYIQLHYFFEYFPSHKGKLIKVYSYDDRTDILDALQNFHCRDTGLFPQKMMLEFFHYDAGYDQSFSQRVQFPSVHNYHTFYDQSSGQPKRSLFPIIFGTGQWIEVISDVYHENVKLKDKSELFEFEPDKLAERIRGIHLNYL